MACVLKPSAIEAVIGRNEPAPLSVSLTTRVHGLIDCQELREQGQQALLVFLTITLQLSFRFASDAEQLCERSDDSYKRPLEIAKSGLEKIRRFEEKVVDRNASARIHEQSNKLAALLAEFPAHDKNGSTWTPDKRS